MQTIAEVVQQLFSLIMEHLLQATAEVLLQEAVDDLLDEAHARQEEYYKKHDVSSEDEEVRGSICSRGVEARLELKHFHHVETRYYCPQTFRGYSPSVGMTFLN